jgi:tRNA-uridine 2-sulfurtransferase
MSLDTNKVVVAMSGGVDSSVAAHLLKAAGHDCVGVFLHHGQGKLAALAGDGCASSAHAEDARKMAEHVGIPFEELDVSEVFTQIVEGFASEYAAGRTPNPCIVCNVLVKFGALMDYADQIGAQYVATGHHIRMGTHDGAPAIHRGKAAGKDQSYVLFALPRERLARMLLPLGDVPDKAVVRESARELGLTVHDKPDSQDICFTAGDGYRDVLELFAPEALRTGDIVDTDGTVLGQHEGYGLYTIGQRKGLRVAAGVPVYVSEIDAESARVTLGEKPAVMHRKLIASGANWHADMPETFDATIQVRYNHRGALGRVTQTGQSTFEVAFTEPIWAITPGQAAVIYVGDRLVGGGWIDSAED